MSGGVVTSAGFVQEDEDVKHESVHLSRRGPCSKCVTPPTRARASPKQTCYWSHPIELRMNLPGLASFLAHPKARQAARGVSDWMDLQWSLLLEQLRRVAPQARGRLLDVGCG